METATSLPPRTVRRRSVETELPLGPDEQAAGVFRATRVELGRATAVFVEFTDGLLVVDTHVRGASGSVAHSTALAFVNCLERVVRIRARRDGARR